MSRVVNGLSNTGRKFLPGKELFTLIYLLKIHLKDIRKRKMISDDFLLFRDIIKKTER